MNPADWIPALALLAILTRELLWLAGVGILLSGIDDLAMDLLWFARVLPQRNAPPPPPAGRGHYAVLVPAWDESEVIGAMVRATLARLGRGDVTLFVGTYPNDPATREAVLAVGDPRVRLVETSRPGPTSKADCLNHLWRGVKAEEARAGRRFTAIVLHDAEDLVHPSELDVFDRFLPGLALVQLPVVPLIDRAARMVSGHYADEFAEVHTRDMMVRGLLGAAVPSAGVGTAFARDALAAIEGPEEAPFNAASLTEDYEIAHRLHALGFRGRMVRVRKDGALVATRAYFPATIETAVRQKGRWLTGIALAGWDQLGWPGGLAQRWLLLRDRKGLLTSAVTVLAYGAAALMLAQLALRALVSEAAGVPLPPPATGAADSLLAALLVLNGFFLLWRIGMRAMFTAREHGPIEGLLAIPRAAAGNLVNALAALRAVSAYRRALDRGTPPPWDKTAHRFPEPAARAAHG